MQGASFLQNDRGRGFGEFHRMPLFKKAEALDGKFVSISKQSTRKQSFGTCGGILEFRRLPP